MSDLISFSKEIAKTIGLNESILLAILEDLSEKKATSNFLLNKVQETASLWDSIELRNILLSLEKKGLISINKDSSCTLIKPAQLSRERDEFILNEPREAVPINKDWEPDDELIEQTSNYGIPTNFVLQELNEFKHYWHEKKEVSKSWGLKFLRHVIKSWRKNEIKQNIQSKKSLINREWFPEKDTIEILERVGVKLDFIEDSLPEFILFWKEKGELSDTWNSKFIAHIRKQWERSEHIIDNYKKPFLIKSDWKPNQEFYDVLKLSNITVEFADQLIPEFILYWTEERKAHSSWNSKFFQHVKFHWNNLHKNSDLSNDIEKRVISSWEITEQTLSSPPLTTQSKKDIQEKLDQLKIKYKI